ncbi:MAG: RNA polymerase sigma factor [Verrucomicrobiaceae bacterium]
MTETTPKFQTTRWTLLDQAKEPEGSEALDELCRRYWGPVFSFLRRLGCSEADAKDLTQDFFVTFMGREGFSLAKKERGSFRSFLLTSARNHFLNARKAQGRIKRGGHLEFLEVNEELDATSGLSPDEVFEKRWAEDLIDRALSKLKTQWETNGRPFQTLAPYLSGDNGAPPLAETAEALNASLAATKSAVLRFRKRFGELVKEEVRATVGTRTDEADELEYLLQLLSR